MSRFSEALKADRTSKGMSQKEFSRYIDIEYQTYFKVEQGHRPPSELFLMKYALASINFYQTEQGQRFLQAMKAMENELL